MDGRSAAPRLLAEAARLCWGLERLPPMARLERGKPWFPDRPDLYFNLSHSGPLALAALSDRPVGADIELIRPRRAVLPLRALSPEELDWFQARGGRWEDFYSLWTLKESRCKRAGQGLDRRPGAITVPPLGPGEAAARDGLVFTALGGEGWRAAVCGGEAAGPLRWL